MDKTPSLLGMELTNDSRKSKSILAFIPKEASKIISFADLEPTIRQSLPLLNPHLVGK